MSDVRAGRLGPEVALAPRRPDLRVVDGRRTGSDADVPRRDLRSTGGTASAGAATSPDRDPLAADVLAARGGDQTAFTRLVEATHRETYALALHLTGCPEDARDVTQEAYLRAYRGLDGFRSDARFSTWMYRITANAAMSQAGRSRKHRHDELRDDAPIVDLRTEHDPALVADAGDLRDRLLVALGTLPPRLRAVVVLRDVYELSHDAIAAELGISVTAAKVRLHRARHKLRLEVFPERAGISGTASVAGTVTAAGRATTNGSDRASTKRAETEPGRGGVDRAL